MGVKEPLWVVLGRLAELMGRMRLWPCRDTAVLVAEAVLCPHPCRFSPPGFPSSTLP